MAKKVNFAANEGSENHDTGNMVLDEAGGMIFQEMEEVEKAAEE